MNDLDTTIEGEVAGLHTISTWLRGTLRTSTTTAADSFHLQRSRSASAWLDGGGEAFRGRVKTVADAADTTSTTSSAAATTIDVLATALGRAKGQMQSARQVARDGGLTVSGNVVHHPGAAPPEAGQQPGPGSPTRAQDAWDARESAVIAFNHKITTWNSAVALADEASSSWQDALQQAKADWAKESANLTGVASDFISESAAAGYIAVKAPLLANGRDVLKIELDKKLAHLSALNDNGRITTSKGNYYWMKDEADDLVKQVTQQDEALRSIKLPKGFDATLKGLGWAAFGYSVYDDIAHNNESPAQAAVSNGGGMLAAMGAGTLTGAAIGSFIPIPGVGTAVGAVGGFVVGTGVGLFTSGAIDSLWDSGFDQMSDVTDALGAGVDEVTDTAKALGDVASDAGGAVKDKAKDAWHAIF